MKKIFYAFTVVGLLTLLLTACSRKAETSEKSMTLSYSDTVGLAEFQEWKMQNERVAAVEAYKKSVADATPVKRTAARKTSSNSGSGTMISGTENQAKTAEKKGWSKAAKGAAIGAGSGAILGAVIHKKNRALGAVIGGVVGGGVGYGIGRSKDKKDGRH